MYKINFSNCKKHKINIFNIWFVEYVINMSSVQERKHTFFRSASLEKLKCTAALIYPLQQAGLKITKESQRYILESSLIVKSRTQLYRSYLISSNAIADILFTILVWVLDVLAKLSVINPTISDEIKNKYKIKQKKLLIFRKKIQNYNLINNTNNSNNNSNSITTTTTINHHNDNLELDKLFKEDINDKLIKNKQIYLNRISNCGKHSNSNSSCLVDSNKKCNKQILQVFVYGVLAFIYAEVFMLCHALVFVNTKFPPGLLFMITNLVIIATIIIQMTFNPKSNKIKK